MVVSRCAAMMVGIGSRVKAKPSGRQAGLDSASNPDSWAAKRETTGLKLTKKSHLMGTARFDPWLPDGADLKMGRFQQMLAQFRHERTEYWVIPILESDTDIR